MYKVCIWHEPKWRILFYNQVIEIHSIKNFIKRAFIIGQTASWPKTGTRVSNTVPGKKYLDFANLKLNSKYLKIKIIVRLKILLSAIWVGTYWLDNFPRTPWWPVPKFWWAAGFLMIHFRLFFDKDSREFKYRLSSHLVSKQ